MFVSVKLIFVLNLGNQNSQKSCSKFQVFSNASSSETTSFKWCVTVLFVVLSLCFLYDV